MDLDKLTPVAVRVFFWAAFILLGLGTIRFVWTAVAGHAVGPNIARGQLLAYSTAMLAFAIALLLRQIRDELRGSKG